MTEGKERKAVSDKDKERKLKKEDIVQGRRKGKKFRSLKQEHGNVMKRTKRAM